MNKKNLSIIILVFTILTIGILIVLNYNIRYKKLIINKEEWDSITKDRNISTSINLESIEFNDYNLIIDNDNNTIYYSVINNSNKYNPSIKYKSNKKIKLVINQELGQNKDLKIMIYNNKEYRTYTLITTNYPILNMKYNNNMNNIDIELFNNYINSSQRVVKSKGKLKIIKENEEYSFSLIKESLGNNKRDNHISIFGMDKRNEYIIRKVNNNNEEERYVEVFINNKYIGLYSFGPNHGRRNDNFERNRENNR